MARPLREIECHGCRKLILTYGNHSKYCPECARKKELEGMRLYHEKQKRIKSIKSLKKNDKNINQFLEEKAEYKALHNTYMSYGQYMALRERMMV